MAEPSPAVLKAIAEHTNPAVPYPVVLAIAERESAFDPSTERGAAGEVGMFQLLPDTLRRELHYTGPLEALEGPAGVVPSVRLASGYLASLYNRWHTWPEAIRAWNGSGSAARAYAAAVVKQLPRWDQWVLARLEFFRTAQGKRSLKWGLAAVAALVVLVLLASRGAGRAEREPAA